MKSILLITMILLSGCATIPIENIDHLPVTERYGTEHIDIMAEEMYSMYASSITRDITEVLISHECKINEIIDRINNSEKETD